MISAYCINSDGVLVYSGFPIEAPDLTYEHHNGQQYGKWINRYQYEVFAVGRYGLIHGYPGQIFSLL